MSLLRIGEVFGYPTDDDTAEAQRCQADRRCPFRGGDSKCTKGGKKNPLGVCSLTDGKRLAVLCPYRFLEKNSIFVDVGRLAFGVGKRVIAVPEVKILRVPGTQRKRIGKIDYLVAELNESNSIANFVALEIQAVYFSGPSIRSAFEEFLKSRTVPEGTERRPDWRSSAQKRLMPQLALKVPVFRRWGRKFFVAVDSLFFDELPEMRTVETLANSEVTWMVYSFTNAPATAQAGARFTVGQPRIVHTTWDDVLEALREGTPPAPEEILEELEKQKRKRGLEIYLT